MPILVFLGLSVIDLGPTYVTNRHQTDVRQHYHLMQPKGIKNLTTTVFDARLFGRTMA